MSLQETDDAAKAVQKTPYRISLDYIESQILSTTRLDMPDHLTHVTVLLVELKNGFIVLGKSVPADPGNFDFDLGMRFAREDAIRQLWPLFAFALCCDMNEISVMEDLRK